MVKRLGSSVVLVDLELPDGPLTLIQKLHATNPDLPIIGITAAAHSEIPLGPKSLGIAEMLRKPISLAWKPVVERVRDIRKRRVGYCCVDRYVGMPNSGTPVTVVAPSCPIPAL